MVSFGIRIMASAMVEKLRERILAVSYAFPPWLAPRSIQVQKLLNFLSRRSYEITVLRKSIENMNVPLDYELAKLLAPGIEQIAVKECRDGLKGRITRKTASKFPSVPDSYNAWAFDCYWESKELLGRADVLMTFSTPISDHIVGVLIKRVRKDIPWIACFSDPFVDNPYWRGKYTEKILNGLLERKIVRGADCIVFVNEYTRRKMMERFPSEMIKKSHVIPHGFEESMYSNSGDMNKKLVMRHLGEFYGERTPETLFRALRLLASNVASLRERLAVEIYCSNVERVEKWIAEYEVGDIVTGSGLVSYLESLALMKSSDVLLVIDAPAKENLFLTSKLIDYVGAKKAIFAITPGRGPTAELMVEMGFTSSDFYDVPGIAKRIGDFLAQKEAGALSVDIPRHVYDRFRMETIAERYISLIESMGWHEGRRITQSDLP
jgi:glycosyltransferase involved in cell wall biosynthesis